jgi:hypothetical protein
MAGVLLLNICPMPGILLTKQDSDSRNDIRNDFGNNLLRNKPGAAPARATLPGNL